MRDSIKGLSRLKKGGHKVGRLKFRSEINSLPLAQYNVTYKIENTKYIKLQKFKKAFKVIGLAQIPNNVEFANANLVRKNGDYFLYITTFSQKNDSEKSGEIGFDFGVKNCITDSNGTTHNFKESITKRQRGLHKSLSRKKKGSKNRDKFKSKLKKEYAKTKKRKNDRVNKFISKTKKYKRIYIQKESVKEWHKSDMKNIRKAVQQSALGGIIERLKNNRSTFVVDRWFASTKTCSNCGEKQSIALSERTYKCNACGCEKDRDTNSAINILNEGRRVWNANVGKSLVENFAAGSYELSKFDETRSLNASA
jgi:transposase